MRREPAKRFAAAVSRVTLEEVRVNFDLRIRAFSGDRGAALDARHGRLRGRGTLGP
jgi:hypothetical protein